MLDLIVLGIVPGTTFVITLWWALLFALICSLFFFVYIELTKTRKDRSPRSGKQKLSLETA